MYCKIVWHVIATATSALLFAWSLDSIFFFFFLSSASFLLRLIIIGRLSVGYTTVMSMPTRMHTHKPYSHVASSRRLAI